MAESKRPWFRFWEQNAGGSTMHEESAASSPNARVEAHEFNSNIPNSYIRLLRDGSTEDMPYTTKQIRQFARNPMHNIEPLRELARWAYYTNGVVATAIDFMRSLHTLDTVVASKSRHSDGAYPANFKKNKAKMVSTLQTIRYKQIIRDGILKDANDGMYAAYFETVSSTPDYRAALTDLDIYNITEINALGVNAMVISLPIDYVRIIGRKNNSYQIAFDLRYFSTIDESNRKNKLLGFPKEIQEGYLKYETGDLDAPWLRLDNNKTIVTKIKSEISDPFGIPFAVAALDDVRYAQYFIDTKRRVLDSVNNQVVYETFPEGKEKGTSALTASQQEKQHNMVKGALSGSNSSSNGVSFFSLASGTKLDSISLDISILDEKNETSITNAVNKDLGFSAAALDGSSTGNYSTANLNLELVAANVYTWIEDIVEELNKCINHNIICDPSCRVEFYVLPITMVNRDKTVGYMSDLYSRGKGSLYAWIAATGFSPDVYTALMDYELQEDFENRYPVHRTSFTVTGKDAPEYEDHNTGGRPSAGSDAPASIQEKTNDGNNMPKPSTG